MARKELNKKVFFRHEGAARTDVFFRVAPQAFRFQQGSKSSVEDTLGGYYLEQLYSKDQQYSLKLAEFTIEGTTGAAYRAELDRMIWIWHHQSDRKKDGSPADIYFFDLISTPDYQGIKRSGTRTLLIHIENFAYDESVNSSDEIRFTLRGKVLRDLLSKLSPSPSQDSSPAAAAGTRITPFRLDDLKIPDLSKGFGAVL